jgi:hypothetical protein
MIDDEVGRGRRSFGGASPNSLAPVFHGSTKNMSYRHNMLA